MIEMPKCKFSTSPSIKCPPDCPAVLYIRSIERNKFISHKPTQTLDRNELLAELIADEAGISPSETCKLGLYRESLSN